MGGYRFRRIRDAFFVVAITAFPSVVWANENEASPVRSHEITGGVVTSFFVGHRDLTATAWALDVGYHYRAPKPGLWQSLRLTAGIRIGGTDDEEGLFDIYGRGEMIANVGPWTPTLGPELGITTLGRHFFRYNSTFPDDLTNLNEKKLSPFYVAIVATPIRFCFSRVTLSALELSLGAPVNGFGTTARFQLGLLHVGGTL